MAAGIRFPVRDLHPDLWEAAMLTFQDCLGCSGLTEDEIDAIAEHEHVPTVVALEMGSTWLRSAEGVMRIERILLEDIIDARAHGQIGHAESLAETLWRFDRSHPAA